MDKAQANAWRFPWCCWLVEVAVAKVEGEGDSSSGAGGGGGGGASAGGAGGGSGQVDIAINDGCGGPGGEGRLEVGGGSVSGGGGEGGGAALSGGSGGGDDASDGGQVNLAHGGACGGGSCAGTEGGSNSSSVGDACGGGGSGGGGSDVAGSVGSGVPAGCPEKVKWAYAMVVWGQQGQGAGSAYEAVQQWATRMGGKHCSIGRALSWVIGTGFRKWLMRPLCPIKVLMIGWVREAVDKVRQAEVKAALRDGLDWGAMGKAERSAALEAAADEVGGPLGLMVPSTWVYRWLLKAEAETLEAGRHKAAGWEMQGKAMLRMSRLMCSGITAFHQKVITEELEGWWDGRADWLALLGMRSRAYIQEDRGAAARAVEALGTGTEVALGTIQAEGGGESSGVHGIAAIQIDDSDDDAEAWRGSGSSDISGGGCGGGGRCGGSGDDASILGCGGGCGGRGGGSSKFARPFARSLGVINLVDDDDEQMVLAAVPETIVIVDVEEETQEDVRKRFARKRAAAKAEAAVWRVGEGCVKMRQL